MEVVRISKEKYYDLRRMRLKNRSERLRQDKNRIWKQNQRLNRGIRLSYCLKPKAYNESSLEKKKEIEDRTKAEEVLNNTRKTIEIIKDKKTILKNVPNLTKKIDNLLSNCEIYYKSAKYEKLFDLSHELQELIEKAETEISKTLDEQKKRRKDLGKYLYAVIPFNEEKIFGNIGINDEAIHTLTYRDIAAVVSDTSVQEYELTEENVRKHETVLRRMMGEYSIVPVEFGTVIKNERVLKRLLRKSYNPTKECLKLVDQMVELGVKVVLKKEMDYEKQREKNTSTEILKSLKMKAKQSVSGELFSDRLFINESFLVDTANVDAFSEEVARIENNYPMYKLLYSGPWAPYNFVYIKIGKEGIEFNKKR